MVLGLIPYGFSRPATCRCEIGLPLLYVAHGAVASAISSVTRLGELIRSLFCGAFARASKTPLIARTNSTPIEGSNVSATASIASAACQAAFCQSPPPDSAIARRGIQFARRRLWKPGGISGVALDSDAVL